MRIGHGLAALLLTGAAGAQPPPPRPAPPPPVPTLEFAFEEIVELAADLPVGPTALGRRNIVPITGGTFQGPRIRGTIVPGGWDWQLTRVDGCLQIKADYMLRADDGAIINVLNQGVACRPSAGETFPGVRTLATFEPPLGKHEWLGKAAFVGTLEPYRTAKGPAVRIRFFRVR